MSSSGRAASTILRQLGGEREGAALLHFEPANHQHRYAYQNDQSPTKIVSACIGGAGLWKRQHEPTRLDQSAAHNPPPHTTIENEVDIRANWEMSVRMKRLLPKPPKLRPFYMLRAGKSAESNGQGNDRSPLVGFKLITTSLIPPLSRLSSF